MRIKKVEITNFRGIARAAFEFVEPRGNPLDIVLLTGESGSGKTALIEACILALGMDYLLENHLPLKSNRRVGAKDFSIKLTLMKDDQETVCSATSLGSDGALVGDLAPVEYLPAYRGSRQEETRKTGKKKEPGTARYPVIRRHLIETAAKSLFQAALPGILDGGEKSPFAAINHAWHILRPEREENFEVKPLGKSPEEGCDIFLIKEGGKTIPFRLLGGGEQEAFMLIACLATGDYQSGIIFIDEPALHLTPDLSRNLLPTLLELVTDTQLICAAKSPEIINSRYHYERFQLTTNEGDHQ